MGDERRVDALADFELRGEFRVLLFALLESRLECARGQNYTESHSRRQHAIEKILEKISSKSSTDVRKLKRSMRPHLRDIVSFEQPAELLAGERHDRLLAASRPVKLLFAFDHLVPNHKTIAVPKQNLQLVASLADEAEQRVAKGPA